MNRATFRRRRVAGGGSAVTAALVTALLVSVSAPTLAQTPRDKYDRMRDRQTRESLFTLFAEPTLELKVNQFQCGLRNQGDTCSDVFNSPTGGGGFWPTGSPNQYMFNSGLNMAGIIDPDAGFDWAGDTTGAYFMDARGTQQHGEGITNIYNSLNQDDLAMWPCATEGDAVLPADVTGPCTSVPNFPTATAFITDTTIFEEVLYGAKAASQQDSWLIYWDGNPAFSANREHPMGITVEQRTMGWNFPVGNEANLYFVYNFTNVSNNPYFQRINEAQYFGGEPDGLPDAGWTIDSIYVSFDVDPDVTADYDFNYSTAILPFNMGVAYEGEFVAPDFTYFPDLFVPPFFTNAPGLVGIKYLRSPIDPLTGEEVGLTLFTVHENPSSPGAQFPDPYGVQQLWRYLSGNIRPALGDPPCTFTNPKERRLCFLAQTPKDTRFLQASGPFSLGPGESQTVVVAMFAAATVETDLIELGNTAANAPGVPTLRPGCAGEEIRPIEVGAGWVATSDSACAVTAGVIGEDAVIVVPKSLLGRGRTAQSIFNGKFLGVTAPQAPDFQLVAGDGTVTVVWQPSATDTLGDPFFSAAGDPTSDLFNPNYRQFDVEGYRIYRGSSPDDLSLIAQFDRGDTEFVDANCETDDTFIAGTDCPAWGPDGIPGTEDDEPVILDISGPFIQYPVNKIFELADGSPIVTEADTLLADLIRTGNARALSNTGIPFAFVDDGVRNGFQYFYQVRAFDTNSLASGPSSLISSSEAKSVFPQAPAPNQVIAALQTSISGDDGVPLNPNAPLPSIDAEDGTFSGPMPPSDAFVLGFAPLVERLLPEFSLTATVDSVVLHASGNIAGGTQEFPPSETCPSVGQLRDQIANPFGACWAMHLTVDFSGDVTQQVVRGYGPWWSAFGRPAELDVVGLREKVTYDPTSAEQFGVPLEAGSDAAWDGKSQEAINNSTAQGPQSRRFGNYHGGSRWFSGDNESVADPTQNIRVGHLEGVDTVWSPISHTPLTPGGAPVSTATFEKQCFNRGLAFLSRAADTEFTWSGGTFGTVRDVAHNVDVPFHPKAGATWGFLTTDSNGNGVLDWQDFNYIDRAHQIVRGVDGGNCDEVGGGRWDPAGAFTPVDLTSTPTLVPTSTEGLDVAGVAGLTQTGTGFGLFVFGERYIFELSDLPGDGTTWTLRTYSGTVSVDDADAVDPSGYEYEINATGAGSALRPMLIPGLTFNYVSEAATELVGKPDLELIHTVPDPYYAVSQYDLGPATKNLRFVNLPARATIRIYSLSGMLVDVINHDDPSGGGQATWDVRNRSDQFVASGVYFFHVVTPEGDTHVGKFTIINFSGS